MLRSLLLLLAPLVAILAYHYGGYTVERPTTHVIVIGGTGNLVRWLHPLSLSLSFTYTLQAQKYLWQVLFNLYEKDQLPLPVKFHVASRSPIHEGIQLTYQMIGYNVT